MQTRLRSSELSCPSCVAKIEKSVGSIPGVETVTVRFNTGKIDIEHDENVDRERLVEAVKNAGYEARVSSL